MGLCALITTCGRDQQLVCLLFTETTRLFLHYYLLEDVWGSTGCNIEAGADTCPGEEPPVGRCELWRRKRATQMMRKKGQFVNGKIGWVSLSGRYEKIELADQSEPGSLPWTVRLTLPNKSHSAWGFTGLLQSSQCRAESHERADDVELNRQNHAHEFQLVFLFRTSTEPVFLFFLF